MMSTSDNYEVCRQSRRWTMSLLLVLLASRQVSGRLDVNVARGKPAASSCGVFTNAFGEYSASKANDGNTDPLAWKHDNSCVVSEESTTMAPFWTVDLGLALATSTTPAPFWTVDLGLALAIVGVKLFNRGENMVTTTPDDGSRLLEKLSIRKALEGAQRQFESYRSDNFVVGMLDVYRLVELWDYDELCGQYPGEDCCFVCTHNMAPHRHVVVQFPDHPYFSFCELEVYIRRFDWSRKSGYRMNNRVVETFQVDRQVHCMNNCTMSPLCDSYNYRKADGTCEFNTHATPLEAVSTDVVADSAWGWWSPNFVTLI